MTKRVCRSVLPVACTCTVIALSACTGTPTESERPAPTSTTAPPAPAAASSTTCKDKRPVLASLAPGSITTDPGSWPSGSTMAKIKARGYLIVGTSGDAKLWGARNPVNGKIEGFDVDVAARVAQALGLKPADTVYKVLTIAQRVPALQAGSVDLVAERMTINCDRWQGTAKAPQAYVNMSTPYYSAGARLLVRKDSPAAQLKDLARQKVCGVAASTSLDALNSAIAAQKLDVQPVVASEPGRCLVKFQEGEVDAVVGDDTTLAGLASQDQYAKIVGDRLNSSSAGFGLNSKDDDFTRFTNVVLEKMRTDGSLTELYDTWMKPTIGGSAPSIPQPVYGRVISALQRQS